MSVIEDKDYARQLWKAWRAEKDPDRKAELFRKFGKARAEYCSLRNKEHTHN